MDTMPEYLQQTKYCDCEHEAIRQKAKDIVGSDEPTREMARKVFRYVRDQIPFGICEYEKASDTLRRGLGHCVNKAGLQIALLRALKIPARYHVVDVHRDTLKGLISGELFNAIGEVISHAWCECYLDGKWISCETIFDRPLYEAALKKGIILQGDIPSVEWDGKKDLVVLSKWILADKGTLADADDFIDGEVKEMSPIERFFAESNAYTERTRRGLG